MSRSRQNRMMVGATLGFTVSLCSSLYAMYEHPESIGEISKWGLGLMTPCFTCWGAALFSRASCDQAIIVDQPQINQIVINIDENKPNVIEKKPVNIKTNRQKVVEWKIDEATIPDQFKDIAHTEIMDRPVQLANCVHTVDESTAQRCGGKCPSCRIVSDRWNLNQAVASMIDDLLEKHKPKITESKIEESKLTHEQIRNHRASFFEELARKAKQTTQPTVANKM